MKTTIHVLAIDPSETKEWFLYKHYARRLPNIVYAFGLYDDKELIGVCSFGVPASPSLVVGALGEEYKDIFFELNRLCVNDGLPKNTLSFFVGQCLRMLNNGSPKVIVSYADSGMNHHGYIYQATNWIYTGITKPHIEYSLPNCGNKHSRHALDDYGGINSAKEKGVEFEIKERTLKHRYFYFIGNKREKKRMKKALKYPVVPYPKGDNVRYDASYKPNPNLILF